MVRFLTGTASWGVAFFRMGHLFYLAVNDAVLIWGRRLFETWHLLKEMRYVCFYVIRKDWPTAVASARVSGWTNYDLWLLHHKFQVFSVIFCYLQCQRFLKGLKMKIRWLDFFLWRIHLFDQSSYLKTRFPRRKTFSPTAYLYRQLYMIRSSISEKQGRIVIANFFWVTRFKNWSNSSYFYSI